MYSPADLHGVMAMMPAFATEDANDINATNTVDVGNLKAAVDRIIDDGIDVIATTGSYGEFHTLLQDEYETIIRATIEAVNGRVPVFLGCTSLNSRETVARMRLIRDAVGHGVLVGVPFYFPSTVDNAVRFYRDIAELFPTLSIMIYHNPPLHNITIPVAAFERLRQLPNVVAMKDSHRDTGEFMKLNKLVRRKVSVFVNQGQYYPFAELGAPGFWSIEAWMGPAPLLALRDAVADGNTELAGQITLDLMSGPRNTGLSWRETAHKISAKHAGYCNPGPLRPPFVEVPDDVTKTAKGRAEYWLGLCQKYPLRKPALAGS